jgi:hypothetical protein
LPDFRYIGKANNLALNTKLGGKKMKDKKDRRKRIRIIGAIAIVGMFVALFLLPRAIASDPDSTVTYGGSRKMCIDSNYDEDDRIFSVSHDNWVELFRIQENGRVGIGDASPDALLDFDFLSTSTTAGTEYGSYFTTSDTGVVTTGTDTTYGTYNAITRTGATGGIINTYGEYIDLDTDDAGIGGTHTAYGIYVNLDGNADANYAGIFTGGHVGIGTTGPSRALEINSAATGDNLRLIYNDGDGGPASAFVDFDTDTNGNLYIQPSGTGLSIGTSSPGATLDVQTGSGGAATIGHDDNSATGNYAIALGSDTEATMYASIATGWKTTASGDVSTAMGEETTASGRSSTTMGWKTVASDFTSTAIGYITTASGEGSIATGRQTTASGDYSTAMGHTTVASGSVSTAMGFKITAQGDYSFGIGLDNTARTITQANTMSIMGGKVGIGAVSPAKLLHLGSDAANVNGEIRFEATSADTLDLGITTSDQLKLTGGSLYVDDDVILGAGLDLQISSGSVTATHSFHDIIVESSTSDYLDTIYGDVAGQILVIRAADSLKTIQVRDESVSSGNIILFENDYFDLDHVDDTLILIYDGSNWLELSRSDNST